MDEIAAIRRRSAAKTAGWMFGLGIVGPAAFLAFGMYRLGLANGFVLTRAATAYESSPTDDPAFWFLAAIILGATLLLLLLYVSEVVQGRRFPVGAVLLACAAVTAALSWWVLVAGPVFAVRP